MASTQPREYLVESIIDHCSAFSDHLQPLKFRQYAADFPVVLLENLGQLSEAIKKYLKALRVDPDFLSLEDDEAEEHILRYSKLYSYLYVAASFVERSDIPHTVVELANPIKRFMQLQCGLESFEILLHSLPILNYSFYYLGNELSNLIDQLNLQDLQINLPKQLVTIGFPGLHIAQILLHSIIAHELGHCLYVEHKLEDQLLKLVKPDEKELDALVKTVAETKLPIDRQVETKPVTQRTLSEYIAEVEIKSSLIRGINDLSKLWVKELTCDAIGYCLFGPAYLFAAINVLTVFSAFDHDRGTHPSNRMRFLLLYKMLDKETDFFGILDVKTKEYLDSWRTATQSRRPEFTDPIRRLTGNAILNLYNRIISFVTSMFSKSGLYSASQNAVELSKLVKRAKELIPPNELIENRAVRNVKFQSILNAGWLTYLSGLEKLQKIYDWTPWEAKTKFNEIIAKAIELNEIQRRWREVQ